MCARMSTAHMFVSCLNAPLLAADPTSSLDRQDNIIALRPPLARHGEARRPHCADRHQCVEHAAPELRAHVLEARLRRPRAERLRNRIILGSFRQRHADTPGDGDEPLGAQEAAARSTRILQEVCRVGRPPQLDVSWHRRLRRIRSSARALLKDPHGAPAPHLPPSGAATR